MTREANATIGSGAVSVSAKLNTTTVQYVAEARMFDDWQYHSVLEALNALGLECARYAVHDGCIFVPSQHPDP